MKVLVNREYVELGEWANLVGETVRRLAKVPDDFDLWQRADYQHREYLGGPMTMDAKIEPETRLFLSPYVVTAFVTAPRIIGADRNPTGSESAQ